MAKNLKLNIKNAQLAEALKLSKPKAPSAAKKKKAAPEEEGQTEVAVLPAKEKPATKTSSKKKAEKKEPVAEVLSPEAFEDLPPPPPPAPPPPAPPPEPVAEELPPPPPPPRPAPPAPRPYTTHSYQPPREHQQREHYTPRPPTQGHPPYQQRPPYQPRQPYSGSGEQRQPYQQRPPFTRPPARPGGGFAPGQQREYRPPGTFRPGFRPGGPPRPPGAPGGYGPRPYTPRPLPRPDQVPPPKKPTREFGPGEVKKPGFKEFRDLKTQRKPEVKRSFDSRDRQGLRNLDDEEWRKRRPSKGHGGGMEEEAIIRPKTLKVRIPITLKDLASEMKLKASQLISKLFMQGVVITLNDYLSDETTVQLLGHDFDCEITIDTREEERLRITDKTIKQEIQESDPSSLITRPPVITFMGHVDHGKTSLIDAIRKTNMAAGEAGAITQHIGAFKCHTAVGDITILDTPGHEAFSEMRARGADVTDIVVLVVAGDEGLRTQTLEAIKQAQEASVPMIVAMNKSDKPNFNAENVYRELSEHNLLPEVWGGTVITVACSALTGAGVKELLELLALQAEILEIKANPSARARGAVIESELHKGMGSVATVLVQNGTLKMGDALVFGHNWARVKTMHDENGKELKIAGPSTPVKITGLSGLPSAGSEFIVVKDEREARELSYGRTEGHKVEQLQKPKRLGVESLLQQKAEKKERKVLNIMLRADVQGSLEALKNSLQKISSDKVDLNIVSTGIGEVSESDIQLAGASKAIILGFHTEVEAHAEPLIKQLKVVVKIHDIIYHAVDDVKALMKGLLDKVAQETDTGQAIVKAVFKSSQIGNIAGCQVTEGTIRRNNHIRVMRDGVQLWKGPISSLKKVKEDVREVSKGMECGILLQGFNSFKENDVLDAFEITYLEQDL